MHQLLFEAIGRKLDESNKILLVSHQKPDGDACGSVLAMASYLYDKGKEPVIFFADPIPAFFDFLPHVEKIKSNHDILAEKWDAVIFLDAGDSARTGINLESLSGSFIINIDHHFKNPQYGHINIIDGTASSACEIVYRFFRHVGYKPDRDGATCLLNGILTDTMGFSNGATTHGCMEIASDLIKCGAKLHKIYDYLMKNKTLAGLKLWGLAFSRIRMSSKWNLAYTYITEDDLSAYAVTEDEIDGLTNFLNILSDVSMLMVFRISKVETRVSLRTKTDHIDVSRFAGLFGGGGHQKSSGFTLPWAIKEIDGKLG